MNARVTLTTTRRPPRAARSTAVLLALLSPALAFATPQHWGFGFGYLVCLEEDDRGRQAFSVYAPPLHVADGPWQLRWRTAIELPALVPNGLVVGDFWPAPMSEEAVVAVTRANAGALETLTYDVPDLFGPDSWPLVGRNALRLPRDAAADRVRSVAAGDVLNLGFDQLVVLLAGETAGEPDELVLFEPPPKAGQGAWRMIGAVTPLTFSRPVDLAIANFWGQANTRIALRTPRRGDADRTSYWAVRRNNLGVLEATQVAQGVLPAADHPPTFFVAGDALKDGFGYLFLGDGTPGSDAVAVRVAPVNLNDPFGAIWVEEGITFAGADLRNRSTASGQAIMTARRERPHGRVVAADIGRVFGYITPDAAERRALLEKDWTAAGGPDVEVAFVRRLPEYPRTIPEQWQEQPWPAEIDEHFGWPLAGESFEFAVYLKNNGSEPLPAESVGIVAWVGAAQPNVDALPDAAGAISFRTRLTEPLAPFNPEEPNYAEVRIPATWPYALEQPAGWTWRRLNLESVGERWLVVRAFHRDDRNRRNDRYEVPFHAHQLRPVVPATDEARALSRRLPTVTGDPESYEYVVRKLADALTAVWARSPGSDTRPIPFRVSSAGVRPGQPVTLTDDRVRYDATPELGLDFGLTSNFLRFNRADGGGLLNSVAAQLRTNTRVEGAVIVPSWTRRIPLSDEQVVQAHTWYWGRGNGGDPYTRWHAALIDLDRRLLGVRYGGTWPWRRLLPPALDIVLQTRDGQPIPAAEVVLWRCDPHAVEAVLSGTTDADGRWPPGIPRGESYRFDPFDLPLRSDPAVEGSAVILTYAVGEHRDFAVLGSNSSAAHSAYALFAAAVRDSGGYTWTVDSLYRPDAPPPTFDVSSATIGRRALFAVAGERNKRYRLYRRWPPTYRFEQIAETRATGQTQVRFEDALDAADWVGADRHRALYYITELDGGGESNPRRIVASAIANAGGLSRTPDENLLLGVNATNAQPFLLLLDGVTPLVELANHPVAALRPIKAVMSTKHNGRVYALHEAEADPLQRYFTLVTTGGDTSAARPPVIDNLLTAEVTQLTSELPQALTLGETPGARRPVLVGDFASETGSPTPASRVVAVDGATIRVETRLFDQMLTARRRVTVRSGAGVRGSDAARRELREPRDLAVLAFRDDEYVAIADTGNNRIVVWDAATRFVTSWDVPAGALTAVAAHPREPGTLFALARGANGQSDVHELTFDGRRLSPARGSPAPINVSSKSNVRELGLDVAFDPRRRELVAAVTDASQQRVVELARGGYRWRVIATHTTPLETPGAERTLGQPRDVAYRLQDGQLELYVLDGTDRVSRLR